MSEVLIPSSMTEELSSALWALAWPPLVSDGHEVTSRMFGQITDLQGADWLVVETDFGIHVHPDAELNGIADILAPWIEQGYLPTDTNTNLATFVEEKRGKWLVVYDAFPSLFKLRDAGNPNGIGRTREQLIEEDLLFPMYIP